MCEIPADVKAKLEDRVREQIASEIRGDVSALYEFTLPAIRARRIAERDDEPGLSLSEIREFVGLVHEAEVQSTHLDQFHPSVARFSGCPAAVVVTKVRYNGSSDSEFRCIWVYSEGTWFTTALGKVQFAVA
jgi:hypothetical protein